MITTPLFATFWFSCHFCWSGNLDDIDLHHIITACSYEFKKVFFCVFPTWECRVLLKVKIIYFSPLLFKFFLYLSQMCYVINLPPTNAAQPKNEILAKTCGIQKLHDSYIFFTFFQLWISELKYIL